MSELSIKVNIAGRIYPLTVKKEEEEQVREAARLINELIKNYEENYSVKDKQDLLAMCLIHYGTMAVKLKNQPVAQSNGNIESKIIEIDSLVSDYLKRDI